MILLKASRWCKVAGLIICWLCATFVLHAQTVWNKTYLDDRPIMLFSSVIFDDTCYKVAGVTTGHTNNIAKALVGNIDFGGALVSYEILKDSSQPKYTIFRNALIKTSDSNFAFTGYSDDSLAYLLFGQFDPQLKNVRLFRYYTPNTLAYHGNALLELGGSYYLTGIRTDLTQNEPNVFLTKVDRGGNRIYEKNFGVSNKYEEAQSIIALSNNNLLIGAARLNVISPIQTAQTWLMEVDTSGVLIRQWLDPNDSTYEAFGLKQTDDGGFIYATKKKMEDRSGDPLAEGMIVKLNSAFQKEWSYYESMSSIYTCFYDVEQSTDGSYIAAGKFNYKSAWVLKLTTDGQIIWNKKYTATADAQGSSFLTDIDVLADGGLIAVGQYRGNGSGPVQVGWFLKLDSNGCEVENCLVGIEGDDRQQTINDRLIQIQPNPATGTVQLIIENEMIGGEISVYNITGAFVLQQTAEAEKTQLNIAALSKGMYIVTVEKQGKIARERLFIN